MGEPAEWMLIGSMIMTAVGTGVGAYSDYQTGKAQKQQADAQAAENERQAKLENERAVIAQLQGEQEAEKRSRRLAADIGAQYAAWAGSGLLVDGGTKDTLGSVLKTTVAEGQADISTIRDNAAMEVWGHQANASSLLASAGNNRIAGKNYKRAGGLNAAGTTVTGLGQLGTQAAYGADKYDWFK
ncbi:MAG: hypothetical protein J6W80_03485 [Kiritimatiellae bacterium]|nr:hypothetical protein [Kiritimatiellia bacterium]